MINIKYFNAKMDFFDCLREMIVIGMLITLTPWGTDSYR